MQTLKDFFSLYIGVYRNDATLEHRLKNPADHVYTPFLFLFIALLVVAIVGILGLGIYASTKKEDTKAYMTAYTQSLIEQLPNNLTGALIQSGTQAQLHINNDSPFSLQLFPKDGGNARDDLRISVNTSQIGVPSTLLDNEIFVSQDSIGIKKSNGETRMIDLTTLVDSQSGTVVLPYIFTQPMIQNTPSSILAMAFANRTKIVLVVVGILFLYMLIVGGMLAVGYIVWYFVLHGVIYMIMSLIAKITGWKHPLDLWRYVLTLSWLPFIVYIFFLDMWVYIAAMVVYYSVVMYTLNKR